jgi:hypothetical protein
MHSTKQTGDRPALATRKAARRMRSVWLLGCESSRFAISW